MLTERALWAGATALAILCLLLMLFQPPPGRRDAPRPRVDEPAIDNGAPWQGVDGCGPTSLPEAPAPTPRRDA